MSVVGCLSSVNDIAFLPSWMRRVAVWGHGMTAPSCDRLLDLCLHRIGLMGSTENVFLERHLAPGMNVVDVGANQGLYALLMARLVGKGMVYAFEPDPQLFAALENNCRANGIENVGVE